MRSAAPRFACAALLGVTICAANAARADEFQLKDGSTISGAIVGFDENSFKVQTSYGFAIVRKDQVVNIRISNSKSAAPEKTPEVSVTPPPPPVPAPKPIISPESNAHAKPVAKSSDVSAQKLIPAPVFGTQSPPKAISAAPMPRASAPTISSNASQPTLAPPPGMQPTAVLVPASSSTAEAQGATLPTRAAPKPPVPEPIREEVEGNTYVNETYRFQMYKPPTWRVLAGARTVLPGAVAALGTDDESTYLLIGQESAGKSINAAAEQTQKRLADVMENFRGLSQEQIQVGGSWVTERHFRGGVDGQDWSGVVVLVPHEDRLFTIFGMTRADNDLVQIQENVIARAISSIQFATQ